jgi:hypothetical protein
LTVELGGLQLSLSMNEKCYGKKRKTKAANAAFNELSEPQASSQMISDVVTSATESAVSPSVNARILGIFFFPPKSIARLGGGEASV